jgi:hypothetical protein
LTFEYLISLKKWLKFEFREIYMRKSYEYAKISDYELGKELTKEARRSIIKGPKTGRFYRIKGRKRRHRASAKGEPPANLFGNLQKSIDFLVKGSRNMEFGAGNKDLLYARRLELGDDHVKKRPYLLRAINKKEKDTERIFENELERNLNQL